MTWLHTNEAAHLAGVSATTLRKAIDSGGVLARLENGRLLFCADSVKAWARARHGRPEGWLSSVEAAAQFYMALSSVQYLARRGLVTARKIGGRWFVEPASLRAWVER